MLVSLLANLYVPTFKVVVCEKHLKILHAFMHIKHYYIYIFILFIFQFYFVFILSKQQ